MRTRAYNNIHTDIDTDTDTDTTYRVYSDVAWVLTLLVALDTFRQLCRERRSHLRLASFCSCHVVGCYTSMCAS